MSAPHILFVAYGAGHVAMLLPVAKLARQNGLRVTFLGLTTAARMVREAGFENPGFEGLMQFAAPGAEAFGIELCGGMVSDVPVSKLESIAYHGINFAELVEVHGAEDAARLYAEKGRHAFLPVRFMTRVLEELKPDLLVATNSPRAEQAAIMAAGALGIRSVCAVDLFALQEVKWVGQAGYADQLCVLNTAVRDMFRAAGRRDDEIVITGNPAFDRLTEADAIEAGKALRRARGWDDGRRVILWASQVEPAAHPFDGTKGNPELPRQIEGTLRRIVAERDDLRLLVRYHPSEQIDFISGPNVEFSSTAEPLVSVLHAVDLVVVTASTVGLEAHLVGRPVISVDMSIFTPDAPYSQMGIAKGVVSMAALGRAIEDFAGQSNDISISAQPSATVATSSAAKNIYSVLLSLLNISPE